MGKILDVLLRRRTSKTSKFKTLVNLAISRLAILKNQRHVRCSQDRSDVLQLLYLGHHERALLRVEHVIKEQNMLDAFVMIEGYCHVLIERLCLIGNIKECPDELKEAISSLIFAASRCAEFPELEEIRGVFISRFGKEFAARAVELRNNCGVNLKVIQKLSTKQPSLDCRLKVLNEIASKNGINLHLEEAYSVIIEEKPDQNKPEPEPSVKSDNSTYAHIFTEVIEQDEHFSGSMKAREKYTDVVAAAQAAFESAAYAAAAARAAVVLSRSESQLKVPDDQSKPSSLRRNLSDIDGYSKSRLEITGKVASKEVEHSNGGMGFEKIHLTNYLSSESEDEVAEIHYKSHPEEYKQSKNKAQLQRSLSSSSSDSSGDALKATDSLEKEIFFDDERRNEQSKIPWLKHHDLGFDKKSSLLNTEFSKTRQSSVLSDENGVKLQYPSQKQIPRADPQNLSHVQMDWVASGSGNPKAYSAEVRVQCSNKERKPVSVRTRRVHRY
ncbi:hypothetical protein HHK36_006961 [Tetracentron sinense]|uniref:IST1-like protein n=1 Tax=Tetracentron sinense TaxID=13715 RepID=A0A834ZI29_TETSI|nr:hypothetical protein HHK36_006961 [Tetracentron sinense]